MGRFLDRLPPWFTIALSFVGTIAILALADGTLQSPHANHPPAAGHCRVATAKRLAVRTRPKAAPAANPRCRPLSCRVCCFPRQTGGRNCRRRFGRRVGRRLRGLPGFAGNRTGAARCRSDRPAEQRRSVAGGDHRGSTGQSRVWSKQGLHSARRLRGAGPLPLVSVPDGHQLPLLPLPPLDLPPCVS